MPYVYTLAADYQYATGLTNTKPVMFGDDDHIWLIIDAEGVMTIAKGYASDGCSPRYVFCNYVISPPDGPIDLDTGLPQTYYASLVHDALCQFIDSPDMPFSRAQIDRIFYDILVRDHFKWADQYYWAVTNLGPIHKRIERYLKRFFK